MPIDPREIENSMVMEYLSFRMPISYSQKYTLASMLLKKHKEAIDEIDKKKKKLENFYGYDLEMLDFILNNAYARNDLDSYYPLPNTRTKMKAWRLESALRGFKAFMDRTVIECYELKELF